MKKTALIILGVLLIVIGIALPLTAGFRMLIMPERFSSTARVITSAKLTNPMLVANEIEKIQSESILLSVVTNLNLHKKWAEKFRTDELPPAMALGLLKAQVTFRPFKNTRLIEIRVVSDDRNEAAIVANEIAKSYLKSSAGPDGKTDAQLIDSAQPGLRPYRVGQMRSFLICTATAVLFIAVGIGIVVVSSNEHSR
jgi:capsular polysaccharide biosynthesis protein